MRTSFVPGDRGSLFGSIGSMTDPPLTPGRAMNGVIGWSRQVLPSWPYADPGWGHSSQDRPCPVARIAKIDETPSQCTARIR